MSVDERRGWPRDPRILPADLAAAVSLGGEMGRRFADFDWTGHPLGAPQSWPVEMRSVIAMVLTSSFPTVLWLDADELFLIYNDAYIPILADRHPAALGQRGQYAWWDVWPSVKPMLEGVLETGHATWSRDLRLPILTAGRRRERFFTFTYSPLVGADGSTFGIICPSYETTERVLSERRLQLLNAVASVVMDTNSVDDALTAAIAACERQSADVPFVAAYLCEPESDEAVLRAATPSVRALLPRTLSRLTKSVPMPRTRADTHVIDAVAERIDGIDTALGDECPDQALLLPLGEGAASGALLVGTNSLCPLDGDYVNVCQLLAGQLSSALSSAVSYEQQRRRADGLAELDRAKTAFLTNVSHEFRTPLTLLAGPLEDAIAAVEAGSAIGDQLRIARRNAGRLQRLVDSLLDFSRVEAGRATADLVCTDVGALTAHVASSFAELCQRAGLELILDCHPVVADVDSGKWETILLNLLSNAVKYTLAGSITVSVRKDGSLCRIAIRDTGVGIADGDLKRLGERFFRAEGGAGRSVEGTGIGLSLVQGLVDLHGGTVEFVSEIGAGTAVIIRVPRSKNGEPVAHSPAGLLDSPYLIEAGQWVASRDDDAVRTADGHDLILIADDNADMRAYLQRILSAHWSTVLAADGVEAIELARTLRPCVVVTDVMMPRLNGFELVDAIRSDPMLEATPVLMLSARADAEASSEGFARGADDYLPKPFTSRDLVDRVAARVASARRDRASRQSLDAHAETVHNFAQLEAALRSADTVTAIVSALEVAAPKPGDNPLICLGLLDTEGSNLRFEYGSAITPELRDRYHVAAMDTPIVPVDVVKSGQPMIITDTLDLGSRYDHVVGETRDMVRSCISQPLHDGDGKIIGSLGMLWSQPREFTPDELAWAAQVARATQSAVDRIRNVQREHRIAVDFQDHLLDLDHASTVAVVAAVYQPGGEAMRVGGDWYLVMPLEQQRQVAVSVGDVVGHGLPAAIAMSRLRAGVAASALTDASPEAVLENLDRYAATVPGGRCATVSYAVIDDGSHDGDGVARVRYSCAGHPFPLLVTPDKAPAFLPDGRRPPVAVLDDPLPPSVAVHDVPPGSVLLFYTDGLIERPGEGLDHGFARLLGAAAYRADLPVGDLCDELLDRMCPDGGYTDDVVLLALRPCHSSARSFATVVSASLGNVADARHRLRDWLIDVGADPKRESDILLATGEAVTNAIEHGSGNDDSMTVSIEAFVRGTTIAATVSDAGQWSGDSSASQRSLERGRGLTMINGLADDVRTVRSGAGTRVTLTFDRAVLPAAGLVEGVTP